MGIAFGGELYILYGLEPWLIILIAFTIAVNYFASIAISVSRGKRRKKRYLIAAMVINFSLLFIFKYLGFMNSTMLALFDNWLPWRP